MAVRLPFIAVVQQSHAALSNAATAGSRAQAQRESVSAQRDAYLVSKKWK